MTIEAIVSFSGGMDSATVLARAIEAHSVDSVMAVTFQYGSKHMHHETEAARQMVQHYVDLEHRVIGMSTLFGAMEIESALMMEGGEIPEGHYEDDTMSQTVVPGRNLILLSCLASMAENVGAKEVWCGIHSGDHAIYPDCRPEFFEAANGVFAASTENKVSLVAPFLEGDKYTILQEGQRLGVPYELTRTCYKNQHKPCGKCGACVERLEAFAKLGVEDPVEYAK